MREIKFRAWDNDRKSMIYDFSERLNSKKYKLFYEDGKLFCGNYLDNGDWNQPELMQFTGLKDKNGKDIFESDIITFSNGETTSTESGFDCDEFETNGAIFWDDKYAQWDVSGRIDVTREEVFEYIMSCEVIGNIHEHKHLLGL